jgi:UDP-N-acetylglucosamine 2-epimerase (non-hydrolysing)
MKTIHLICAARPNFMKIAPLYHALKNEDGCKSEIIHTGQHYDYQMSQAFFDDFGLPAPHYALEVGRGSHATQTAQTMIAYEKLCLEKSKPDLVVVVGDVNATLACSIVAKKIHLKVAHLEAGLRSFDRDMPEEINRMVTDAISLVGNIMIDAYEMMRDRIEACHAYQRFNLTPKQYGVLTLHRPINVDQMESLALIIKKIGQINLPIIFPVHPRTKKNLEKIEFIPNNIKIIDALGYINFISLVSHAAYIISDSGGIQEETTYLGIPCFTLRDSTERPITVSMGSNQLVSIDTLLDKIREPRVGTIPPLWDGKTANRIKQIIQKIL